ncbi:MULTISPECIES: hypothetical protein [unclassified Sphingobacterium]|uniref:hypothetical protein n=1 Tax=unclassified Sphingobacterium TaxID=2609468 RepID=UPI00161B676A|nr:MULTISPECIES: hypothetical protein [unclassified Sphingobacterium]MBB2952904.1 hypothetical protein [Sphingobacterium sp. JUb56]QQD14660.1 hypothetical protein JAZ75_03740 [Sphingobacterium sp. UDSM-2020]
MQFIKSLSFLLFFLTGFAVSAQNADSTSFEAQRMRVNKLIEDRKVKFGEYDLSLEKKSAIFGLFKSKDDMQRTIDILKNIVITDNNIFLETRRLISIKDDEKQKFQNLASEYDKQVSAYMGTINKLQKENEKLKKDIENLEGSDNSSNILLYIALAIIAVLSYLVYRNQKITKG